MGKFQRNDRNSSGSEPEEDKEEDSWSEQVYEWSNLEEDYRWSNYEEKSEEEDIEPGGLGFPS